MPEHDLTRNGWFHAMSDRWIKMLSKADADWLADTFARNRSLAGDLRMEDPPKKEDPPPPPVDDPEKKFVQADVDRIVEERLAREREATKKKYGDYDELKKKAGESATSEQKIAELQREVGETKREALRRRVQAKHAISDEDADLFLTGSDEEALEAQAKRLAEREAERKQKGNRVSREGTNPTAKADEERDAVRELFGGSG